MSDNGSKGNGMVRVIMLMGGAVGLFSAGLVGTLGFRGQLNKRYLGPLVGLEVEEPPPAGSAAPSGAQSGSPSDSQHDLEQQQPEVREAARNRGKFDLLPDITLPSPFSADETRSLFEELETTRSDLGERLIALHREQKDLELVRSDLNHRWDELDRREEDLEEQSKSIAAERQVLAKEKKDVAGRSLTLDKTEQGNVEALAEKIEKMKPAEAAALLMEKAPDRVALILSYIKAREAGKILGGMPPKFAADVTERMLGILQPRAASDQGGQ